ncbi:MAG: YraN family protein [Ignavibacteria bacterium]|nr:YraN family protein [Ignavibacteria bacterium]
MSENSSSNKSNFKSFAKLGEEVAAKFLTEKGYSIVKRNFVFGKGEIDIIAKDGDCLVFVEVKTRKNYDYGEPEYAITKSKQRQLKKIAEAYFYVNGIQEQLCRFDVITIVGEKEDEMKINHIINAFY